MNSKAVGQRTEAIILAEFLKRGEIVLMPFGDNERYDIVLDRDGEFIRVQCKTARYIKGCVEFSTSSSQTHRGRGHQNYIGQADLFAAYCPALDKVYLVPVNAAPTSNMFLRVEPAKNNQTIGVRWASEYEMLPMKLSSTEKDL